MNKISLLVRKLLKKNKIDSFPIDLKKIAASLKIDIQLEKLENDISGFLFLKNERPIIVVNKEHHENRQRFTIAHELGHFVLDHKSDLFFDKDIFFRTTLSGDGNYKLEKEANKFAAELLMPEELLTDELLKNDLFLDDPKQLDNLSDNLKVSTQALAIRLSNLGWTLF